MRLGTIINEYRVKHGMSMDEFAKRSGLSKAYIGFLEKGYHPKTLNPIKPSIEAINKCASAMNMDFSTLFNMLDEVVTLTSSNIEADGVNSSEESDEFLRLYQQSSPEMRKAAVAVLKSGLPSHEPPE